MFELLARGAAADAAGLHGITPLMCAAYMGHVGVVRELLRDRRHAAVNAATNGGQRPGLTALMAASQGSQYTHAEVVRELLKGGAAVAARDFRGWTAQKYALMSYNWVIAVLLQAASR